MNPQRALSRILFAVSVSVATMLVSASGADADVAHLRSGKSLDVSGFRVDGEWIVLQIQGGGEITLPTQQVLEIRRTAATPPPAPPAAELPSVPAEERLVAPAPQPSDPETMTLSLPAGAAFDTGALREMAARIARRHGVDEALVQAVITVESRYDAFAVSPRGAMGLMQLMPKTAERFAVRNVFDPVDNVEGGVRYLKELLSRYSGQTRLALAAYNAGEEAVERYSGIPPYRETVVYVSRVLRELHR